MAGDDRRRLGGLIACGAFLLAGLVWLNLLAVNAPSGWEPVSSLARQPIALFASIWDYPTVTLSPRAFSLVAVVSIGALWIACLVAAIGCGRFEGPDAGRRGVAVVLAVAVAAHAFLAAFPPVFSNDLYHYAQFGRMVAFHGLDPYLTAGEALRGDPIAGYAHWRSYTSHYGPTFTWLSAAAAAVGGDSPLRTALAFKGMAAAFNLASCLLVDRLTRGPGGSDARALVLFAWNPLALVESAGSGHNDAVMIAFALLGLWLAKSDRPVAGFAALLLSATVKYVTAILALLFFVQRVAAQPDRRARWRLCIRLAAAGLALLVLLYLPFRQGVFAGTTALLFPAEAEGRGPRLAALGAFVALAAALSARGGPAGVLALSAVGILYFVLIVFAWTFPWYLLAPMTFGILVWAEEPGSRWKRAFLTANLVLAGTMMLFYGVIAPVDRPDLP